MRHPRSKLGEADALGDRAYGKRQPAIRRCVWTGRLSVQTQAWCKRDFHASCDANTRWHFTTNRCSEGRDPVQFDSGNISTCNTSVGHNQVSCSWCGHNGCGNKSQRTVKSAMDRDWFRGWSGPDGWAARRQSISMDMTSTSYHSLVTCTNRVREEITRREVVSRTRLACGHSVRLGPNMAYVHSTLCYRYSWRR